MKANAERIWASSRGKESSGRSAVVPCAFGYQNISTGVDLKTGRIQVNPAKTTGFKTTRDICPAPPGAKDWQPSSFSLKTNWLYIPHHNLCYEMRGVQANYISGTPYVGANVKM